MKKIKHIKTKKIFGCVFYVLFFLFFVSSCSSEKTKNNKNTSLVSIPLSYAKRFGIAKAKECTLLFLFNDAEQKDTAAVYVLYNEKQTISVKRKNAIYVKTPVKNIACLSTIYAEMIKKLGSESVISAVDNADYYYSPYILNGVNKGDIKEIAKGPEINIEAAILLKPDVILTFGMGSEKKKEEAKLQKHGIAIAVTFDHLEPDPLARAEWIKFVAAFLEKDTEADSLFKETENRYNQLKNTAQNNTGKKPSVFTEMKYTDAWYVPGGKSYLAILIKDAGGNYLWKNNSDKGSLALGFENVFIKAKEADVWINLFNTIHSRKDILAYDERYNLFKALKTGEIYNHNKVCNKNGYSIYWEEGICNPDEILMDLMFIFHPELLPGHSLKYYKKIN